MNKMIKILYFITTLEDKSPNNVLYNLISQLGTFDVNLTIVTIGKEKSNTIISKFEELGINIICLDTSFLGSILFGVKRLKREVDKIKPDIIQSQGIRADYILSMLQPQFKVKKICVIHNFFQYDYSMTYGKVLGAMMKTLNIKFIDKFDYIIGVSKAVCDNLKLLQVKSNLISIENGVNIATFHPIDNSSKMIKRNRLMLSNEKKIFVVVGSIDDRKDPFQIINAFRKFNTTGHNHLIFVGSGKLFQDCINYVRMDDDIVFLGSKSNIADYLQVADYYLSASKAEGLPMAVLEALSCGLPVVLSDIEPHVEIFEKNKKIGSLYDRNNDEDLIVKLNLIDSKSRDEMSGECIDLIKNHFTVQIMAAKYYNLYNKINLI